MYLNIKFQLNCFSFHETSVKEIFSFQKLKISFIEILFQKKSPHASLILLFQLRNREKVICKPKKKQSCFRKSAAWKLFLLLTSSYGRNCIRILFQKKKKKKKQTHTSKKRKETKKRLVVNFEIHGDTLTLVI